MRNLFLVLALTITGSVYATAMSVDCGGGLTITVTTCAGCADDGMAGTVAANQNSMCASVASGNHSPSFSYGNGQIFGKASPQGPKSIKMGPSKGRLKLKL